MVVILPGYESIFENDVYSQDHLFVEGKDSLLVKKIIVLGRYEESSEDRVVGYLKQKVMELEGVGRLVLADGSRIAGSAKSPLEQAVVQLPESVRRDIVRENEDCIRFIRGNTPARVFKEDELPSRYLHVNYGLIPDVLIRENKTRGNIDDSDWYNIALAHDELKKQGFGGRYTVKMLLDNGALPKKGEIDILVKHGTWSSRTLDINRPYHEHVDDMKEIIDVVYEGLSNFGQINELIDISDSVLEKITLQPVIALLQGAEMVEMARLQRSKDNGKRKDN